MRYYIKSLFHWCGTHKLVIVCVALTMIGFLDRYLVRMKILDVVDRFEQVDRIEVTLSDGSSNEICDPEQMRIYKNRLKPIVAFATGKIEILRAIEEQRGKISFYIGDELLVTETLYSLEKNKTLDGMFCTEQGNYIARIGRHFYALGS